MVLAAAAGSMPRTLPTVLADQDRALADLQHIRETIEAAAGTYDCPEPCDGYFELFEDSSIEDYAALNRWLGHHGRCGHDTPTPTGGNQ